MINVYFETNKNADLMAIFDNEEIHNACLPTLEKLAQKNRMFVTESCEDTPIDCIADALEFADNYR